jgi:hypothetical protein
MIKPARWPLAVSLMAIFFALPLAAMAQQPPNPNQPPPKRPAVQGQPHPAGPPGQGRPAPNAQFHAPGPGGPGGQQGQFQRQGGQQQFRPPGPGGPGTGQFQGRQQFQGQGGQAAQFRGPGGQGGQFRAHAVGERGYSFHAGGPGRRGVGSFNERERAVWYGGRWRHEERFGRYGYWWEVNGVWYFYDQPTAGPPGFVSEMEFSDDDPDAPVMVGEPQPMMAPPPYVVYERPPVVCIGPLCVR